MKPCTSIEPYTSTLCSKMLEHKGMHGGFDPQTNRWHNWFVGN